MPDLPWFVYAMLLAPLGLLLVAAAYKTLQVRAAREWPSTAGKVVVSKAETRQVKVIDSDRAEGHRFEERNFADITYEYSVAGRKLRNNRVSIGEDRGNFEVAETIAKYPVGTVVTVYYNRTRRCWSATCRRACGAASASARRSYWRSYLALRSACIS
jgi:hypothetical protein